MRSGAESSELGAGFSSTVLAAFLATFFDAFLATFFVAFFAAFLATFLVAFLATFFATGVVSSAGEESGVRFSDDSVDMYPGDRNFFVSAQVGDNGAK